MAIHGARHLIFLSWSGAKNVDSAFFEELKEIGCTTQVFVGDISKLGDVKQAVSQAKKPIAGVMQMAMVSRVCPYPTAFSDPR
jgi:KR domain